LINRLAYQAEIDNKFATQIFKYNNIISSNKQTLISILLKTMREYSQQNNIPFD